MINVSNLTVVYPDNTKALADVSFAVAEDERIAVIGGNGAGKSTLLLSMVGVVPKYAGGVEIDGIQLSNKNLKDLRQKVGMVFQNPDDQLFMTKVYDDVAFGLANLGLPEHEIAVKVNEMLELLGITHLSNRMPHRLSGGEKRRVAIAGVLAMEPSVILMDEPTSFLDPFSRRQLIAMLNTFPHTLLIATHDLDMAKKVCSRVIALKSGSVAAIGTTKEILSDAKLLESCGL